jgi:hypothetical protein
MYTAFYMNSQKNAPTLADLDDFAIFSKFSGLGIEKIRKKSAKNQNPRASAHFSVIS